MLTKKEGKDMNKEKDAAHVFGKLTREEKTTYLVRLREIVDRQAPVPPVPASGDAKAE